MSLRTNSLSQNQWRSHGGGQGGQSALLTAKNLPKLGKKREKIRKKREKEEKSGRNFHFAPPDR